MQVLAAPGLKVPMEEKPRNYITDTPPEGEAGFTVPDTVYYQRRVLEGDLIEIKAQASVEAAAPVEASAAVEVAAPAKSKKGGA